LGKSNKKSSKKSQIAIQKSVLCQELKPFGIGLVGFGTIGTGVVHTLTENRDVISKNLGLSLKLVKIVDIDVKKDRGVKVSPALLSTDYRDATRNPDVQVVIELIGGTHPAREIVEDGLRNGKHVVTANKELISKHGRELHETARRHGVCLLHEASVGGGIPILTPLLTCLKANRIKQVVGIVNGTTNYILTRMEQEGVEFENALKEAQQKGYAEADPTSDVDGYDSAYKIAILTSVAFGKGVRVEQIYREGIRKVTRRDIQYAGELGYRIKLIAVSRATEGGQDVRVHPALLPLSHPLASIHGVLNAVYVEGSPIGSLMFVGEGAGASATSSAVIGDVIEIAEGRAQNTGRLRDLYEKTEIVGTEKLSFPFYMRMIVDDKPGVLADITSILSEKCVSISSVVQKARIADKAEIVWLTHPSPEKSVREAVAQIRKLRCVKEIPSVIHVM